MEETNTLKKVSEKGGVTAFECNKCGDRKEDIEDATGDIHECGGIYMRLPHTLSWYEARGE